jgi:CRISPR/Cas system CSM-associated protein Csm3 (group 7 of RAMP superfamily)
MNNGKLIIDFKSFWHCGSGMSAGQKTDALIIRDSNNLPCVPGKTLKGILRDAACKAESFGWLDSLAIDLEQQSITDLLFGTRSGGDRSKTQPGCMQLTSAAFSEKESRWLAANPELIMHLTRMQHNTAIDHKTGSAKELSLRSMEVCVPTKLESYLTFNITSNQESTKRLQQNIQTLLPIIFSTILPLIENIGSGKQRGLGQVSVTYQSQQGDMA